LGVLSGPGSGESAREETLHKRREAEITAIAGTHRDTFPLTPFWQEYNINFLGYSKGEPFLADIPLKVNVFPLDEETPSR
jgi:hypothetical protein